MAQRGRRYGRKRGKRRYRKRRYNRGRGKGNSGVRYFKLKQTNSSFFTTDASGNIALKLNFNDLSIFTDYSSIQGLFDVVRIGMFKCNFIPLAPNDTSSSILFAPLFACQDYTNPFSTSITLDQNQQYENSRLKNIARPWKHVFKPPKLYQYQASAGLANVVAPGYFDTSSTPNNGVLYFNATGLTASKVYGSATWTAYIMCRNRK